MTDTMTGGCQCGRVRYEARVEKDDAYLCHCRMCQRATGGVAGAMTNVTADALTWTGEPDWYRSSAIGRRPFCSACGTPLGFQYLDGGDVGITIGSFDDPSRFRPTQHYSVESLHEAWIDTRDLPRTRTEDDTKLTARWLEACGKLPD